MNTGPPSWVLDTNVVVSALLIAAGFSGRLIDAVLKGDVRLSYDDRIEAEYREVLARPRFSILPERREAFLAELRNQDMIVGRSGSRQLLQMLPDMDDLPFLEVAFATSEGVLVTGNLKHFPSSARGRVVVLSPRQAWERLAGL